MKIIKKQLTEKNVKNKQLKENLSENQILDIISKHKKLFDDLKDM